MYWFLDILFMNLQVTAHGTPDTQNSWLSDLHLGLVKVLGQLSGAVLSSNPSMLFYDFYLC